MMPNRRNLAGLLFVATLFSVSIEGWLWLRSTRRISEFDAIDLRNPSLSVGGVDGSPRTDVGHDQANLEKMAYDTRSRNISHCRILLWVLAATVGVMYVCDRVMYREGPDDKVYRQHRLGGDSLHGSASRTSSRLSLLFGHADIF